MKNMIIDNLLLIMLKIIYKIIIDNYNINKMKNNILDNFNDMQDMHYNIL